MKTPITPTKQTSPTPKDHQVQGEGDYAAARRNRSATEAFAKSGKVANAAKKAAPANETEAKAMRDAEAEGKKKARQ
jgi:hypothetical protein